jgi:hypothetical protein
MRTIVSHGAFVLGAALVFSCGSNDSPTGSADAGGSGSGGSKGSGGSAGATGGANGAAGGAGGKGEAIDGGNTGGAGGAARSSGASGSGGARGTVGGATTDGGGTLCTSLGWCEILNTKLADVCPDPAKYSAIQANEGCSAVINDWSGGAPDETRSRLIVWGGGHGGYFGNEVYAFDLGKLTMARLNDPSDVTGYDFKNCSGPDAYPDGRPVSRHTYDGFSYIAHADKLYAFSGAKAPCGYQRNDTWTLDLATVATAPAGKAAPWALKSPTGASPKAAVGAVSDYDPNTHRVFLDDGYNLLSYDFDGNAYALLNDSNATNAHIDYHMTGRVDPKHKLFIVIGGGGSAGGGVQVFDIGPGSSYAQQNWTSQVTGCAGLMSAVYPGLAYDPVEDKLVGWAGGDTVYLFDADTKSCTTMPYAGGPGKQNMNGTMGRFRYFASLKVFAVVNDWQQNAYTLRLTP